MLCYETRNYGCRFLEVSFLGLRTIILENEKIRVMILLDKGTEIVEFLHKETDTDFLWRSPQGLNLLAHSKHTLKDEQYFTDFYTGGWFEAFPNVGKACEYKGAKQHFYGEVCYLPWSYSVIKNTPKEVKLKCSVHTIKTPFIIEKIFTIKSNIATLFIEEMVTNVGNETVGFQWAHHPNFGAPFLDENCIIEIGEGEINIYEDIISSRVEKGSKGQWPFLKGKNDKMIDFTKMPIKGAGIMDLLFISKLKDGYARVKNTKTGLGFELLWDKNVFNNLTVWICANGDTGYPRYGDTYVLTLMPKSSDKHMLTSGDFVELQAGESKKNWITASVIHK